MKKTIKKAPHVEKAKIEEKTKEIKKIDAAAQQSSTEKELFLEKRVKDLEEELAQLKKTLGTSAPEKNGEKTAESPNAKRKREIRPSKKVTKKDKKSDEATPSKEGEVKNEDEKKEVEKKDAKINGKQQSPPPIIPSLCQHPGLRIDMSIQLGGRLRCSGLLEREQTMALRGVSAR